MSRQVAAIGDVAEVAAGGGAPQEAKAYTRQGTPFVRAGSLKRLLGGDSETSLERLADEVAKQHKLRKFPRDTVVFAKSGMSATKGLIYRLREDAYVVNHLAALVPSKRILPEFLEHSLRVFSPTLLIQDAAYPSIRLSDIAAAKILLPPVAEQRRIAAVLDKADELRTQRRAALAELDTLTQSIFFDMFGDPVINPKGLPKEKLGAVGVLDRGVSKHRPRNDPKLLGGRYPLIQTGEVANSAGYITTFSQTYSDLGFKQSKLWPTGTLCITIAANIAKTGILTFDACFPDSVVGFRAEHQATVEFIRVWLSFLQKTLEETAPESAQKNINLAILRSLDVPVPPLASQREFARRVSTIEALKAKHRTALAELDALFASLQHRAFSGQL